MKLFLLTQNKETEYDTYDSAVVAAMSVNDALMIHPSEYEPDWLGERTYEWPNIKHVQATYIGDAVTGTKAGIILSSFNAG